MQVLRAVQFVQLVRDVALKSLPKHHDWGFVSQCCLSGFEFELGSEAESGGLLFHI